MLKMKRQILLLFILLSSLYGADEIPSDNEPIVVKDKSGLSDDQVREIAKKSDKKLKEINIKEVFEVTDIKGKVDVSKLRSSWEELSPTPKKYDWVKTKSGEWFKGEIKAMYDNELEFDSDEIGIYNFHFDDIVEIKSYHIISTNIEGLASFTGVLRFKNNSLKIIQGDHKFTFKKEQIVSFAKSGESERNNWSGKLSLSFGARTGNKEQLDYTTNAYLNRRTSKTRLRFDYLGRISKFEGTTTANDHRINEKFDIYLSRDFFWTPVFSEYYQDSFQNIQQQYTFGMGLGYSIVDNNKLEWDISGGPALIKTKYVEVALDGDISTSSASFALSTKIEYEYSKNIDLTYDYKVNITEEKSGLYKHHMVLKLENELLSWLDVDITGVWDYTKLPEKDADGVSPLSSDYQLLFGLGVEF